LNQFFNTGTFNNLAPGNYDIIVQDQNGCFILLDVDIIEPAPLVADVANVVQNLCLGDNDGSFDIVISGGTAPYSTSLNNQDPSAFVEGQLSFSGLVGGTDYFIFVKDANGCETIAYVFLNAPVEVIPTVDIVYNCIGNIPGNIVTVSVNSSAVGNVQYALDGGTYQPSNLFQNVPTGNHTISVQHTNGCIKTADFIINANQPLAVSLANVQNVLCNSGNTGSVTVATTGGTGTIEFAISPDLTNFSTNNTFSNLIAGTYTIIVRDGIGCSVSQQVIITQPTLVTTSVSAIAQELCTNDGNGSITIAIAGGVAPYSTSLNNSSPGSFVLNQVTFTNLVGGQTYTIYVLDANGCITSIPVTLDAPVTINPTVNVAYVCNGNTVGNSVTVSVNTAVQNDVTYSLDGGTFQTSATFTNVAVGNHTIVVRHNNGCEKSVSFIINPSTPIQASFTSTNVTCNGLTNGLIQVAASGGNGALEYAISPNLTSFSASSTFNNLAAGNYTVTVRDALGCSVTLNVSVTQPDALNASLVTMFPDLCYGDNVGAIEISIAGGTAPYSTSLNNENNYVVNQVLFENLSGGQSYTIYVRDTKGCTSTLEVAVSGGISINPGITITYDCFGSAQFNSVKIKVGQEISSQVTYSLDGGAFQNGNVFTNLTNGNHTITILHALGCSETTSFTIENYIPISLTLVESNLNQITATATGGSGSYTYYLNGVNYGDLNELQIFANGTYTVLVEDSNGCTAEAQITMDFIDIDIPNFFTPNDDGDNDTWVPENLEGFPNAKVEVFDRYGRIIVQFGTKGSWDGTYNGSLLPTGDYWYTITLDGGRQFVGNVTLYR